MLLALSKLQKSYPLQGGRHYVLRNIDLEIRQGEFISIVGPSGSGKSSLLHVLGLMDDAWEGEFTFAGMSIKGMSTKHRQALQRDQVGFIFQQYHLIEDMTVYENLDLPLSYRNISASERKARVGDILDRFNIVGKKDLFPSQLSGGQQQLVGVARAVITRPSLLLADEPTGALHSSQGNMIMDLLTELNAEGTTIVQVTHSETHASRAHRVAEIFDGWLKFRDRA